MVLTVQLLNRILSECGFRSLESDLAYTVVNRSNQFIDSENEAAMFMAQLIHESGGFVYNEEWGKGKNQPYGEVYYGRGYIQLTWKRNYEMASKDTFGDDRLVRNPDMVSNDKDLSMRVSVWFWDRIVREGGGVKLNKFGMTTKAINPIEKGPWHPAAKKRYEHYKKAARILGVTNLASDAWE